jgi:hypothetical protein
MHSIVQSRSEGGGADGGDIVGLPLPPESTTSDIYRAFDRQLGRWRDRYAGRPACEMVRLWLLALEREENVVVAYDPMVLGRRLAAMPLPAAVSEVMRDALVAVWRDEQRHARDVRRALFALGSPVLCARALFHQVAGAMGGWAVSVRQHRPWSDGPLARTAATLLTEAGTLSGRVPAEVRPHLDFCSFRDFCAYNVHTESTAWLCWYRLAQLAAEVPDLAAERADDFLSVAEDEECHRRVFRILAESLTTDDRMRPEVTAAALSDRLGAARDDRRQAGHSSV